MNHLSEWTKLFDENTGRYRYRHKGPGLIRDTLMAIGKAFKGTAKNVVKTAADNAAKTVAEKAGQKVGEIAVEKGSKRIQEILRKRKVSQDAKKKLENILQNQVPKKPSISPSGAIKLNRLLALIKNFFSFYVTFALRCSEHNNISRRVKKSK